MLQLLPMLRVHSFSRVLLTQFSLFKTYNKEKKIPHGGLFVFIWHAFCCSVFMWPFPTSSLEPTQYQCTRSCPLPNTALHHCQPIFWPSRHTKDWFEVLIFSWQHCFHLLTQLDLWGLWPCFLTPLISIFSPRQTLFFWPPLPPQMPISTSVQNERYPAGRMPTDTNLFDILMKNGDLTYTSAS